LNLAHGHDVWGIVEPPARAVPRRTPAGTIRWVANPDQTAAVRSTLVTIYGAVAAVVRNDRDGLDLLVDDLFHTRHDLPTLLAAVSLATLDRLDAALGEGPDQVARSTRALAEQLLVESYRCALTVDAVGVQAAARRLDAIRRHDHQQVAHEIDEARRLASDHDLLLGSLAVLTATVSYWAERTGRSMQRATNDLCLAASLDPV
jgi:hypothetical protein